MAQHTTGSWTPDHTGLRVLDYNHGRGPWRTVADCTPQRCVDADGDHTLTREEGKTSACLIAAAPDLLSALRGEPDEPVSPLSWLRSLIDEVKTRGPDEECEDLDAFDTMIREVEALHRNGMAAVAKAEGRG